MFIRIDSRRRVPLQQQIYESVRQAILNGLLTSGARLPSSRTLAENLGIARMTAVLAFEQLAAEGYITSRVGAGTYVNHDLPDIDAQLPVITRASVAQHPRLSKRGIAMSQTARIVTKIDGPPRAFRLGYRERLEALHEAVSRYCNGTLELRPVATGLHAVADLPTADAASVSREALARGIEAMPLSRYYSGRRPSPASGLVLGFGGVPPRVVTESVKRLAAAIEAATPLRRPK